MIDDIEHRRGMTFAQAEGAEPLPRQLELKEISPESAAALWAVVYNSLLGDKKVTQGLSDDYATVEGIWRDILRRWWITQLHKASDEFSSNWKVQVRYVKSLVYTTDYLAAFNFLQFALSGQEIPYKLAEQISHVLNATRSAYRVIENYIVPITSEQQAVAASRDLALAKSAKVRGPYNHLNNATGALTGGDWASAVRESIHAVEAAAKSIEPSADTLGPALSKLRDSIGLAPALGKAFGALYGYASDEKTGVRHALVFEGEPAVTERDALFMFGACAAFVGYLLSAERRT